MSQRLNNPDREGVLHFVTLNVRERRCPFRRPEYVRLALEQLRFEADRHPAAVAAYVVMPDHLHFLIALPDGALSRFLARYKPNVTRHLDAMAQEHGRDREREWLAAKGRRELWQDSKHSLHLTTADWIRQKIAYIHDNPVRRCLVSVASQYPWSSFAAYHPEVEIAPPVPVDLHWAEWL